MERFPWSRALGLVLVLFLFMMFFQSIMQEPGTNGSAVLAPGPVAEISYSSFKEQARAGNVKTVIIREKDVQGEFGVAITIPGKGASASRFTTQLPSIEDPALLTLLEENQVEVHIQREEDKGFFWIFLANALPLLLLIGLWIFIMRRSQNKQMGPFGQFGQVKARLFDMFFRGESVGHISGTGLGLTIAKQAVEVHGGTISVESDEGKGSTFVVVLPYACAE